MFPQLRYARTLHYLGATVGVFLAVEGRRLLDPVLGDGFPFALLFFAILFAAWLGGFGPALAAVVSGALAADYFLLRPRGSFHLAGTPEATGLMLFVITGLGIALLGGSMQRSHQQAEASAQSARRKARLIEQTFDAMLVWDWPGAVTYWNRGAERLYGILRSEAVGRVSHELLQTMPAAGLQDALGQLEREGAWEGELERRIRDGRTIIIESRMVLVHEDGMAYVVETNRDITKRVEAERALREANAGLEVHVRERTAELEKTNRSLQENEELISRAFQLSPDCMSIVRRQDRIVLRANEALCRLWGGTPGEILGQPTREYSTWASESEQREFLHVLDQTGECLNYETSLRLSDGRLVPFSLSSRTVVLNGEPCIMTQMRDITARRQVEEVSVAIAAIVESSDDAIIGKTLDSTITSWNSGAEKIFGYPAAEMIGTSIRRIIPPDRHTEEDTIIAEIAQGRVVKHYETRRLTKDGRQLDISVTVSPIKDAAGRVIGASKIARDITEQKRAVAALRASQEKFSRMFDSNPAATSLTNLQDGRYLAVNSAFLKLMKWSREEIVGRTVFELNIWPDLSKRAKLLAAFQRWGHVEKFEMQLRTKSGDLVDLLWSGVQIEVDGLPCLLGSGLDITERKRVAEALRESEERMRSLVALMPEAMFIAQAGRVVYINQRGLELWGAARPDQIVGRSPLELLPPCWHPQVRERLRRIMEDGATVPTAACEIRRLDGTVVPVETMAAAFPYGGGKAIQVIVRDITERKQAEAAIQQLNADLERRVAERTAELADLYNNAPCGYHSLDVEGRFVGINETELRWLGYAREEIVGKLHATDLLTPASGEIFRMKFPAFKASGRLENLELEMVRRDGSILPVLLNATFVTDPDGTHLRTRTTLVDYTERKQAELALRASQAQLETANRELEAFSYSVSHDLRAPLRAVDGYARIVVEDFGPQLPPEGRRYLGNIAAGAQQMGVLIDDLLTFSRLSRLPLARRAVNVNALVRESLQDLASLQTGRVIELQVADLPGCAGDPALLKQVWINLLSNALKYTRQRNPAVVEVGCRQQQRENIYFVRDNGAGFDMRYVGKLFGVFQRLHRAEEYEGTGVGLAIVQRVIHRHGGRVWAEAAVDRGATFSFTLEPENPT